MLRPYHLAVWMVLLPLVAWQGSPELARGELPAGVVSSQKAGENPSSPAEQLAKMRPLEGFQVTQVAAEPTLAQPIALATDDRGRLWVAECYSYNKWSTTSLDRVQVLEDADNDGKAEKSTVFLDKLQNLTGVQVGFGGVFLLTPPSLIFVPDANGDAVPDGPPVVLLDGYDTKKVGHNIACCLTWGPDGWLYGCHGIQGDSYLGKPGTPQDDRARINCGVWRYHPTKKVVEAVAHGTTNPWGLDFDDYGEGFFVNCVIGHLWNFQPGAYYKRMYGEHFRPNLYELIDSTSDHLHWGGGAWTESRGNQPKHSEAGGGHAHCGLAFCLSDNFPAEYRNSVIMGNIHGLRLNRDKLERKGGGYVAKHAPDFLKVEDEWFRAIAICASPDGGLYFSDWTDLGECHDNDGVHRTSGRVYKVVYQKPALPESLPLAKRTDAELVALQLHKNDWLVRQSRRLLQERAAAGQEMTAVNTALHAQLEMPGDSPKKLRSLWALFATGGADEASLHKLLSHSDEYVRGWAVKLLTDQAPSAGTIDKLVALAPEEPSAYVRTKLASALRRLPTADRLKLAGGLVTHAEDESDPQLPLLVWYGVEPAVMEHRPQALALAAKSKLSKVRQLVARRIAAGNGEKPK